MEEYERNPINETGRRRGERGKRGKT